VNLRIDVMSIFKDYAKYYNLIYRDKDYKTEIEYIEYLLKEYSSIQVKNILNIGCGTGLHDSYLNEKGYLIDAFDQSDEMIRIAKSKIPEGINFFQSSISDFKNDKKYDAILSLFHVFSYQTVNKEIYALFNIVKRNLKPGGVFVFDCWYGPAVLTEKPEIRVIEHDTGDYLLKRTATPELLHEENIVNVNYEINIKNKQGEMVESIKECHKMRYFFLPELKLFAAKESLEIKFIYEWKTLNKPSINSWNICFGGQLINTGKI
jgi:SAM-dependent methyltransferase